MIPTFSFSQQSDYDKAFLLHQPDSIGKFVTYTDIWQSDFYKMFEIGKKSAYTYIISSDSIYQKMKSHNNKDSLPVIDFSKQELVVYVACPQCLTVCNHQGRDNEPCHRNACMYRGAWYVIDKKKIKE